MKTRPKKAPKKLVFGPCASVMVLIFWVSRRFRGSAEEMRACLRLCLCVTKDFGEQDPRLRNGNKTLCGPPQGAEYGLPGRFFSKVLIFMGCSCANKAQEWPDKLRGLSSRSYSQGCVTRAA